VYSKILFISVIILFLTFHFVNKCPGDETTFLDITKYYPEEQKDKNYLLYINGNPFKTPYIAVKNPENDTVTYYFPGQKFLNALGVKNNYDEVKGILIINKKEYPPSKMAIGLDIKTDKKIMYLPFIDVINFLKLPLRIQENYGSTSYYIRTDGVKSNFQQIYTTPTPQEIPLSSFTPNIDPDTPPESAPTVQPDPTRSGQKEIKQNLDNIFNPGSIPNAK